MARFALRLIEDYALHQLSEGYADLVQRLSGNRHLGELARRAGVDAVLASHEPDLQVLRKANRELVTAAEKRAERLMTDAIRARYPRHAVVGEEHGRRGAGQTRWVLDPVDGTSAMLHVAVAEAFAMSVAEPAPAFGVTVAVVTGEEAIVGVVVELRAQRGTLATANTWVGVRGEPTTRNGRQARPPTAPIGLASAVLASTVPEVMFKTHQQRRGFQALKDAMRRLVTDQNCVGFMRLLSGGIDIVYEADLAYHDAAALIPILEGAGITVTDDHGRGLSFGEATIDDEFRLLAAHPNLHPLALEKIRTGAAAHEVELDSSPVHRGYAAKFGPDPP